MISIQQFSKINIVLASFQLITTSIAFFYSIKINQEKNVKILLLYAGVMLGFIINTLGIMMGLLQIFISDDQTVPNTYCVIEAYVKISGLVLFNTYQILVDIALYLNIYNYKLYTKIFNEDIIQIQVYGYTGVFIIFIICVLLKIFGPSGPFIAIDCGFKDSGVSLSFSYIIIFCVIQPLIVFIVDLFVIIKIIDFYKHHSYESSIRKRIQSLILFPTFYTIITTTELMVAYFTIQSHINSQKSNSSNAPTQYTAKIIIQWITYIYKIIQIHHIYYIINSLKGGIIACVFANLIIQSNHNDSFEFTLPSEERLSFQSYQMQDQLSYKIPSTSI